MDSPYGDANEYGCRLIQEMIKDALDRHGIENDPDRFGVFYDHNGAVKIRRECEREKSNGASEKQVQVYINCRPNPEEPLDGRSLHEVQRQIDRYVRRRVRLREIEKSGEERPLWSCSGHRLLISLFREADLSLRYAAEGQKSLAYEFFSYKASVEGIENNPLHSEDGRVDFETVRWKGISYIGGGRPCIRLDTQVPETILSALPGKLLQGLIDHPVIQKAKPIKIVEAAQDLDGLSIVMEDIQDPLQRPPKGISMKWARIPYHPQPIDA